MQLLSEEALATGDRVRGPERRLADQWFLVLSLGEAACAFFPEFRFYCYGGLLYMYTHTLQAGIHENIQVQKSKEVHLNGP